MLNNLKIRKVTAYLKDLSVVVVGIFLTLMLTNEIDHYSKQKDIKESLTLIKLELESNMEDLKWIEESFTLDMEMYQFFQKNMDSFDTASRDSLSIYMRRTGQLPGFLVQKDAFEVFKTSALMPYFKDKSFLLDIIQIYSRMDGFSQVLKYYVQHKEEALVPKMDAAETMKYLNALIENDPHTFFSILFANNERSKAFMFHGSYFFHPNVIRTLQESIEETIKRIDDEFFQ